MRVSVVPHCTQPWVMSSRLPDSALPLDRAGVTAVIQPGGSLKDADVIAAADAAGVAMVITGRRHFRH